MVGIIDIFKDQKVFVDVKKKGNTVQMQDLEIGRPIYKILGQISSSNLIKLENLNMKGRFIYLQMKQLDNKYFQTVLEIQLQKNLPNFRVAISNMFNKSELKGNQLNVGVINSDFIANQWGNICIDLWELFRKNEIINRDYGSYLLKGVSVMSSQLVRGVYMTTDYIEPSSLSKEMQFKGWQQYYQHYQFLMIGRENKKVVISQNKINQQQMDSQNIVEQESSNMNMSSVSQPQVIRDNEEDSQSQSQSQKLQQNSFQIDHSEQMNHQRSQVKRYQNELLNSSGVNDFKQLNSNVELDFVYGFSPQVNNNIRFSRNSEIEEVVYSSGSMMMSFDSDSKKQRYFLGHNRNISGFDMSEDGNYIISAQDSWNENNSLIKLWDYSQEYVICSFSTPYKKILKVRFSSNSNIIGSIGTNQKNQQIMIIYEMQQTNTKIKPIILAKQTSDHDIKDFKFIPDTNNVLSCGRENIRFWRQKQQIMIGQSVVLNNHTRNNKFECLDIYQNQGYIGNDTGLLFIVDISSKQLMNVYKLHDKGITAIRVDHDLCITGSSDSYLRIWGLQFEQFLLEINNEQSVVSNIDMNQDGLKILVGNNNNGLSVINLQTQQYKTILRSHSQTVLHLEYQSNMMITYSDDNTIRVWDLQKSEQIYEFYCNLDQCTVIKPILWRNQFIAGFKNGLLRIFDIDKLGVIYQKQLEDQSILNIELRNNDLSLQSFIVGTTSNYYIIKNLEEQQQQLDLQIIRTFRNNSNSNASIVFNNDNEYILKIADNNHSVDVIEMSKLKSINNINTNSTIYRILINDTSVYIQQDKKVMIYKFNKGTLKLTQQVNVFHKIQKISVSDNNRYIVTLLHNSSLFKLIDRCDLQGQQNVISYSHNNTLIHFTNDNRVLVGGGQEGILLFKINYFQTTRYVEQVDQSDLQDHVIQREQMQTVYKSKMQMIQEQIQQENIEDVKDVKDVKDVEDVDHQLQTQMVQDQSLDYQEQKQLLQSSYKQSTIEQQQQNDNMVEQQNVIKVNKNPQKNYKIELKKHGINYRMKCNYDIFNVNPQKYQLLCHNLYSQPQIDYLQKLKSLKQNPQKLRLQYTLGYNQNNSQNLIWNKVQNYYGYTNSNLLIIQYVQQQRQKIVTFNNNISCMTLTNNNQYLIISVHNNIFIVNGDEFNILKVLYYHKTNIQGLVVLGNRLISYADHKESSVVIWDLNTFKIVANSYTIDRINAIRIKDNNSDFNFNSQYNNILLGHDSLSDTFQFSSVGLDQLHIWKLENDNLLYYDVFIKEQELTAVEYILDQYIGVGTQSGMLYLVSQKDYSIQQKIKISKSEIVQINFSNSRLIIVSDNLYYSDDVLGDDPISNIKQFQLPFQGKHIEIDKYNNQGLLSLVSSDIYFVDLKQQIQMYMLHSNIDQNYEYKVQCLNDHQIMAIQQSNNVIRLIDSKTGTPLFQYQHKYPQPIGMMMDDKVNQQLLVFIQQQQIISISYSQLNQVDDFQKYSKVEIKEQIVFAQQVIVDNECMNILINTNNEVLILDTQSRQSDQTMNITKILHLDMDEPISDVLDLNDNLIIATEFGHVFTYHMSIQDNGLVLTQSDRLDLFTNPHGSSLDNQQTLQQTQQLYQDMKGCLKLAEYDISSYLVICNQLMYLYRRDFHHHSLVSRVSLTDLPFQITRHNGFTILGFKDGLIQIMTTEDDNIIQNKCLLDGDINHLVSFKSQLWVFQPNGMSSYIF